MKKFVAGSFLVCAVLTSQSIATQDNFIQAEKCECPSIKASDLDKLCSGGYKDPITVGNKMLKKIENDKCKIQSKIKIKIKSGSVQGTYDKDNSYKTGKDICNYEGNGFEVVNCVSHTPAKQTGVAENVDKNLNPGAYMYAQQGKNPKETESMSKSEESRSSGY